MSNARPLLVAIVAATLTGCGAIEEILAEAQLALDGGQAAVASAEATYLGGIVFSSVTSENPDEAAGGSLPDDLTPPGCASWTEDQVEMRLARVTFDDCNGPFGLTNLRGSLVARFSQAEDESLHAEVTTEDLVAGGHPVAFVAAVDIAIAGSRRTIRWHADWTSESKGGGSLTQTSDLTLVLDDAASCRALDGTAESEVDGRKLATAVSKVTICSDPRGRDECPDGTMIHRANAPRREVTMAFDGSRQVKVAGVRDDPEVLDLDCRAR